MKIDYWECEYCDYDEIWTGEEEYRIYGCTHPDGNHRCDLDNKWFGKEDDCQLLDVAQVD